MHWSDDDERMDYPDPDALYEQRYELAQEQDPCMYENDDYPIESEEEDTDADDEA